LIPQDKHKKVCQERRNREKNQRIQSILESAQRVFFSKGYLKATMDEIALEAAVTKPTIYLYFKTKDDLFFTLMLPLIDHIRKQLENVEQNLISGKIHDGQKLIAAIFEAFYSGYETSPEAFRIIQLFQQQKLMNELRPEVRIALNDRGRVNFVLGRRILGKGMELGLLKKVNVYEMADVVWALIVGVIQLEDIKSDDQKNNRLKENTLGLAIRLIANALTAEGRAKKKMSDSSTAGRRLREKRKNI
jgi:TetR/AcrR family transcriptional regulator